MTEPPPSMMKVMELVRSLKEQVSDGPAAMTRPVPMAMSSGTPVPAVPRPFSVPVAMLARSAFATEPSVICAEPTAFSVASAPSAVLVERRGIKSTDPLAPAGHAGRHHEAAIAVDDKPPIRRARQACAKPDVAVGRGADAGPISRAKLIE